MLDLLLVDDEKSVLEAMANTIRWENYGVRLVGTCGNAIEALHFMETSHLDGNYYRRENAGGRWYRDDKAGQGDGNQGRICHTFRFQ